MLHPPLYKSIFDLFTIVEAPYTVWYASYILSEQIQKQERSRFSCKLPSFPAELAKVPINKEQPYNNAHQQVEEIIIIKRKEANYTRLSS